MSDTDRLLQEAAVEDWITRARDAHRELLEMGIATSVNVNRGTGGVFMTVNLGPCAMVVLLEMLRDHARRAQQVEGGA